MASKKRLTKTLTEQRQDIIDEFFHEHGDKPARMRLIARWGLATGRIEIPEVDIERLVARQLADAAREHYYTDAQDRRARRKHQFKKTVRIGEKEVQRTFWVDVDTATPRQMQLSFAFRRRANLMDNKQLQTDVESWNDNQRHKWKTPPIQVSFDYENDLAELKNPTQYPEQRDSDEEDDDGQLV